ncbi:MAG: T9SS type A sorting domain-containing protein [Chitinophagaceae bacterium]|nr:T9SS type A sorting domain-containing protein [Chitinophagaceae bacterium]
MKQILRYKFYSRALTSLMVSGTIVVALSGFTTVSPSAQVTLKDSIIIQKQLTSKKHKIKLYPNNTSSVLFFSASGEEGKVYQLFVFDIDGKLIKQVNIRNKQTTVVNNIEKGQYSFEVFSDDERIENGLLTVK